MAPSSERRDFVRQRIGLIGLILTSTAIAGITLMPVKKGSIHSPLIRAVKAFLKNTFGLELDKAQFNFATNIVMFMPLGFFLLLTLGLAYTWRALGILPMVSAGIESLQFFMPTRGTQWEDLLANSVGGWIGVFFAWLLLLLLAKKWPADAPHTPSAHRG